MRFEVVRMVNTKNSVLWNVTLLVVWYSNWQCFRRKCCISFQDGKVLCSQTTWCYSPEDCVIQLQNKEKGLFLRTGLV